LTLPHDGTANFSDAIIQYERDKMEQRILHTKVNTNLLRTMDADGDGAVSELEWLEYMLLTMQRVSEEELIEIKVQFQRVAGNRARLVALAQASHRRPVSEPSV
jgi:hypothetical protein